jgi:DNA-binding MarR family transcriptional regulator
MSRKQRSHSQIDELANRLHSVAIHLLRRVREKDKSSGEGPARLSALSVLVFGGPCSLGQLAAAEQVTPPTMTRIVTGLESRGLAERVADAYDARRVQIRTTPKGAKLLQNARRKRVAYLASQLGKLRTPEINQLDNTIRRIEQLLKEWT